MNCIVTAGPTYEELDQVRRLTNFSTGTLGSELANFLVDRGHQVKLLLGHYATFRGVQKAQDIQIFSTTNDLSSRLEKLSKGSVDAVFHAAAVSDFFFGRIFSRNARGELTEVHSPKISTREETLVAELRATPKIIVQLRQWFPTARLVGWKFELEGDRASVLAKAALQILQNKTNACVANGRAYGDGFGLVDAGEECTHCHDSAELFSALEQFAQTK